MQHDTELYNFVARSADTPSRRVNDTPLTCPKSKDSSSKAGHRNLIGYCALQWAGMRLSSLCPRYSQRAGRFLTQGTREKQRPSRRAGTKCRPHLANKRTLQASNVAKENFHRSSSKAGMGCTCHVGAAMKRHATRKVVPDPGCSPRRNCRR